VLGDLRDAHPLIARNVDARGAALSEGATGGGKGGQGQGGREDGRYVYEFKVVGSDGRLREVHIDALSAEILKVEDD
jgi:hypothetical protein